MPQFPHLKSRCNGIIVGFKEELLHTMADTWYTYIMFLITISPADFIPYNIMNMFLWYDEQTKVWNCRIIVIQCIVSTSRLCFKCWSSIVSCDLVNSLPGRLFAVHLFLSFSSNVHIPNGRIAHLKVNVLNPLSSNKASPYIKVKDDKFIVISMQ